MVTIATPSIVWKATAFHHAPPNARPYYRARRLLLRKRPEHIDAA